MYACMHLFGRVVLCMHARTRTVGDMQMQIALRDGVIGQIQKANNISRDELARQVGVSKTTAFRIERGDVKPSPKFIAGLINVTGQPFEVLFEIVKEAAA